jgi:hypothetical protein
MSALQAIIAALASGKPSVFTPDIVDDGFEAVAVTAGVTWTTTGNYLRTYEGDSTPFVLRGAATDYEIFVTGSGDALEAGSDALDTWLSFSENRSYEIHQGALGSKAWDGSYQIRLASNSSVLGGGSITLRAERSL